MTPGPGAGIPWFAYDPQTLSEDFLVVPQNVDDPEKYVECGATLGIAIEKAQAWSEKSGAPCRVVRIAYEVVAVVGETL